MRIVSRVTETGLFTEDVGVEDLLAEDGSSRPGLLPKGCIENRPPQGFHHPRWDKLSKTWVETKTDSQILEAERQSKVAEIHSRLDLEASSVMTNWQFILVVAFNIPDDRKATLQTIGKKAHDILIYLKDPARTLTEITKVSWDTWI